MRRFPFILALGTLLHLCSFAQEELPALRPVTSSYMITSGSQRFADTYLTPLHYTGLNMGLLYQRSQAMRMDPQRWTMQLSLGADFASTKNPAKNATMLGIGVEAYWGMMRRWNLTSGFNAGIGPAVGIDAGVLYLSRNGNNPASARCSATLNALGFVAWNHTLWGLPITLRYQASLPVIGAFFSPDYGQLYYQIYLGDNKRMMHCAWWGDYFSIDNLVTLDIALGRTTLRIGYRGRTTSTKVNHLVTNDYAHSLVLGITTEWISLKPNADRIHAKIISAY